MAQDEKTTDIKAEEQGNTAENDVRVLTYDEDGLVDLDMEIDLSDIFDDEKPAASGDDEVLKLFRPGSGSEETVEGHVSDKTMVADRASIKEGVLEENSLEKQAERAAKEDESDADYGEINRKKKRHRRSFFILKVILLLAAASATIAFALSPVFTIKYVEVEGNHFYTDKQIINMSEVRTGGNLFVDAQKGKIKKNLKSDNYFRSVTVRRSIPDTLIIDVDEKEELAALKYGDRFVVIDDRGEVLRIAKIDPEVTEVIGMTIGKMDVGEQIEVEEKSVLKDTMATLHTMKEGDLFFKRIEVSGSSSTAYIYDMMKVRGTSAQLRYAIEEGSLQKVVNKLMKSKIRRGTIILGDNGYISFSPAV